VITGIGRNPEKIRWGIISTDRIAHRFAQESRDLLRLAEQYCMDECVDSFRGGRASLGFKLRDRSRRPGHPAGAATERDHALARHGEDPGAHGQNQATVQ
jgi:hypothetical protein